VELMPIEVFGPSGNILDIDGRNNQYVRRHPAHHGTTGGAYVVTGGPSAVVAAALAANTLLMSLRHGTAATTNLYLTRLRLSINTATVGASAGVPGQIAWQRFTAVTPTGGTARTPARKDVSTGSGTQVLDVRDNNAALTGAPTFGDVLVISPIPNFTVGTSIEYVTDLDEDEFIRLTAGDGICLRTQVAAPATMTWTYTYTIHYLEL
jgi:hypothetical protein